MNNSTIVNNKKEILRIVLPQRNNPNMDKYVLKEDSKVKNRIKKIIKSIRELEGWKIDLIRWGKL